MPKWSEQAFMDALDRQQPDWPCRYAETQDLEEYVRYIKSHRERSDGLKIVLEKAMDRLRYDVAQRLVMPVRAAVHAGLVIEPEEVPDA